MAYASAFIIRKVAFTMSTFLTVIAYHVLLVTGPA